MEQVLAKEEVIQIISSALIGCSSDLKSKFEIENLYLRFFRDYVREFEVLTGQNIVSAIREEFEMALGSSYRQIVDILLENPIDKAVIFQLVSWARIITRGQQQRYNRQLPGENYQRITTVIWKDYNHHVLSLALWNGFIGSLSLDNKCPLIESDESLPLLTALELRPLHVMRAALLKHGLPLQMNKTTGDGFYVNPDTAWRRYKKKIREADKK